MRNPKRIDRVLQLIACVWKDNPDLRLGQLLLNVDITYWMEEDELEKRLKEAYRV